MRLRFLPLILSLQALLIPLVTAVFADEAYQVDYQHLLLGAPQRDTTFFHRPSATSKASLLYTLSEKLVLGAVNPKDGAVVWRQWLKDSAKEESERGFLKALGGQDVVVSAVGAEVQAWDAADGRLVWSWRGEGLIRSLEVVDIEGMRGDVVAVTEGNGKISVTRQSASSGDVVWNYAAERYVRQLTGRVHRFWTDWIQRRYTGCCVSLIDAHILRLSPFSTFDGIQDQSYHTGHLNRQADSPDNRCHRQRDYLQGLDNPCWLCYLCAATHMDRQHVQIPEDQCPWP